MKSIKGVIAVIGLIVKYSAIVMAVIKGIEVVHSELEKIEFGEDKAKSTTKLLKDE